MRYVCRICGYIYDEEAEGVLFGELPEDWKCPLCGAAKADFLPEKREKEPRRASAALRAETAFDPDAQKLSAGQLAALCSNLARGCEKQYKAEESELFSALARYFTAAVPACEDATVEKLAEDLAKDAEDYSSVRAAADAAGDRGAARVCVWGEKVTRILASLVQRYLKEGEALLEGTQIWVCSVCGFVYIGDNPPQICPVCKVPAWKFDQVAGRAKK